MRRDFAVLCMVNFIGYAAAMALVKAYKKMKNPTWKQWEQNILKRKALDASGKKKYKDHGARMQSEVPLILQSTMGWMIETITAFHQKYPEVFQAQTL